MRELTKPQIRKYKIYRSRLFKGSKHSMYVHEDILIHKNAIQIIRLKSNQI